MPWFIVGMSILASLVNWLMFIVSFEFRSIMNYFSLGRIFICVSFIGVSAEINAIVKWNIRLPN